MTTDDTFRISSRADMAEVVARAQQTGFHHHAELLRHTMNGRITLAVLYRNIAAPLKAIERAGRPAVILLGDDDYASTGPLGWAAFRRLSYWARGAMIHETGADVGSYRMAVNMALACQRFLLIETDSTHAQEWGDALKKAPRPIPFLGLLPTDGAHPVMPPREVVH